MSSQDSVSLSSQARTVAETEQSHEAKKQPDSMEKQIQDQSCECLKTSKNQDQTLNKTQAIEKLDLLKETVKTPELKSQIQYLMDHVQEAQPESFQTADAIKQFIKTTFEEANQHVIEQMAQAEFTAETKNPFKTDNPFAAKVITKTDATVMHAELPHKEPESTEKTPEEPSFLKKILNLFS